VKFYFLFAIKETNRIDVQIEANRRGEHRLQQALVYTVGWTTPRHEMAAYQPGEMPAVVAEIILAGGFASRS
jgi:hypothetical protein